MCSNNCVSVVDLDYVVLKINGSDISSLSSYEVVQMFLQTKDNLVVELSRKKKHLHCSSEKINKLDIYTKKHDNFEQPIDTDSCVSQREANFNATSPIPHNNEIFLTLRASNKINIDTESLSTYIEPTTHHSVVSKGTQTTNETNRSNIDQNIDPNKDIVQSIANHFIEQQHHLFEQCLESEIDIEEITLINKDSIGGNLGLSVSCSNALNESIKPVICKDNSNTADFIISDSHDACEDVFISDIQSESIADVDGRLRRGDQILRINGLDIKTKKHAESQILKNGKAVTLLVSRILYPGDDVEDDDDDDDDEEDDDIDSSFEYANRFLPDDYTNVVDKLDKILLVQRQQSVNTVNELIPDQIHYKSARHNANILKTPTQINTITLTDIVDPNKLTSQTSSKLQTENDYSCQLSTEHLPTRNADNSSKTLKYGYDESEHIYETIPEDSESEPLYCSPYQSSNYITAMGSCSSADVLEMQQQTQRVAQWLGLKSQISPRSIHTLSGRPTKQQNRLPNRMYTLTNTTSGSSSSGAAYSACGYINVENDHPTQSILVVQNQDEIDNSSSAYNTGGSNNSASPRQNPPITNLNNENSTSNPIISGAFKSAVPTKESLSTSPAKSRLMLPFANNSQHKSQTNEPHNGPLSANANVKRLKPEDGQQSQPCPQFNAPNLSRYHFVSSQEVSSKTVSGDSKPNAILVHTEHVSEEIPMVWKVKRRPDGTRYIVKRPVRSHVHIGIRKNIRNSEITTTEDDTISEVKIGRYWNKEERKRHIERARERRQHQQLIHQHQQFPTQ